MSTKRRRFTISADLFPSWSSGRCNGDKLIRTSLQTGTPVNVTSVVYEVSLQQEGHIWARWASTGLKTWRILKQFVRTRSVTEVCACTATWEELISRRIRTSMCLVCSLHIEILTQKHFSFGEKLLSSYKWVSFTGCGDFWIKDMSYLPDPCPLPDNERKRSLNQREKLIYAPMSGVGGIVYDKDAVYIDLGGSHALKRDDQVSGRQKNQSWLFSFREPFNETVCFVHPRMGLPQMWVKRLQKTSFSFESQDEESKPSNELVSGIIDTVKPLDEKIEASEVSLFSGSAPIKIGDDGSVLFAPFPSRSKRISSSPKTVDFVDVQTCSPKTESMETPATRLRLKRQWFMAIESDAELCLKTIRRSMVTKLTRTIVTPRWRVKTK